MRNQATINEKIKQRALERKANGTLKLPKPFAKGYDPRRLICTDADRRKGGTTRKIQLEEQYKNTSFNNLSLYQKRRRIMEEQKFKCLRCHNDKWLGKKITLELEHIDGNRLNVTRKNLCCLCPNCHSMTDTWRRKKSSLRACGNNSEWQSLQT